MERTRYIPSIISLAAGFVACLVTMINTYDTLEILIIVLSTLIVFYIVGTIARSMINKALFVTKIDDDDESENEEGEDSEENSDEDGKDKSQVDSEEKQE